VQPCASKFDYLQGPVAVNTEGLALVMTAYATMDSEAVSVTDLSNSAKWIGDSPYILQPDIVQSLALKFLLKGSSD
jgi:hypothetical protein